jgi:2-phospho-L-lactate/phosphoenolpyruvate guanylyltransferase
MASEGPTPGTAVLVPVKAFSAAKVRLAAVRTPAERAELARSMASVVVRAAHDLAVAVVCDDEEVATWARQAGADVLWRPGRGLNGAVTDGVETLARRGVTRVVVAHADLPLATDLRPLAGGDDRTVIAVPDRRDDGTNVISVPAGAGFRFAYGAGSFRRHLAEARRLGLVARTVRDEPLGFDVDVPDDLAAVAARWPRPPDRTPA